jgi:hypothetical protein
VNGVTVQVGPRGTARCCAALGLAIWRNKIAIALVVALALQVLGGVLLVRDHLAQRSPVYVPAAFCPAGQRVLTTASGWPVCTADH